MAIEKDIDTIPKQDIILEDDVPVEIPQEFQEGGDVNIEIMDDGGAEIDFDPRAESMEGGQFHEANLAEFMEDEDLTILASELQESYNEYKSSRSDWEDGYMKGLDLLGFKYENRSEPFQGASGATHPVLAEAVTQFQALAYKELLPANGPVRTQIIGKVDSEKEKQSQRVKDFMNYQLMVNMKEYEPEFDQMLFNLPLAGSTFKKVYFDAVVGRTVSKFVPAEDLVVPYSATSLEDAEAIIHVVKMSGNDLRKQQVSGFYKDVDIGEPSFDTSDIQDKKDKIEGLSRGVSAEMHTLLECHVELDLEGYEDKNMQTGEDTGIKLPYIVTIHDETGNVLSIRRNYAATDQTKKKKEYFVHFKFLPGLGFYGFGLIHMIGGLSRTATAALRQLLDAGTLSNLPSGFKQRGIRVRDEAQPLQPGEFRDVDAPGGNLRDAFMPLPFKEPSGTLLQLMGVVVAAGQRFASIADMQVGDGNQSAAVGTTVALLERGSRVMSAIHKRLYQSMKCEFMLLANNFATYLPKMYPYDIVGGQRQVFASDFDNRIDIIPVADPNIFSQTQRITVAQTELQMAMSNPDLHNIYQAYRHMYEALGVKDIDLLLPPPAPMQPMDPASENIMALNNKKFQAFPKQDHQAHMRSHIQFMGTMMVRNNPKALARLQQNCMEHIQLMATEQVQIEFVEEMQQMQQLGQQLQAMMQQMGPQAQQNPQFLQMQQQIQSIQVASESRKSQLIAEFTEDYVKAEKEVLNQIENDPVLKLKDRDLDLKAREEQRKEEEGQQKANMDMMKLMQNKDLANEKLEQDDKHAKLRASVSLAKQGINEMKATVKEIN
jgi:hypothetical protein|tara:strand:- start:3616 stop:6102 length:2487 start_codon:yes stop_codon:yes gene_type:complete